MPVVVQPACCNQARWTTTNSDYGDFYVSVHKEVKRQSEPVVHTDCTKKADSLGKELTDVKAQLECLKQRCKREPCPKTGLILPPGADLNPNLFSPKIGKCQCPSGPGLPNCNPHISVSKNEYNGAKKHDPQFLEQHIKSEHPRLVKRLHPPKPYSAPCVVGNGDHFPGDELYASDCGSKSESRGNSERPRHCKMIGLYKRTDAQCPSRCGSQEKSNNNNMHIRIAKTNCNTFPRPHENIPNLNSQLPSDQRYNFYRYYDKNLSGFSLRDIFINDDEIDCTQAIHGGYLDEIFPYFESCISSTPSFPIFPCYLHNKQCPEFVSGEECSRVSNSIEGSEVLNEGIKTTDFDFCCYGKLSQGETINFSASKTPKYLETSKHNPECLDSSEHSSLGFKPTKFLARCLESKKKSIPTIFENKEFSNELFNTQGTQTLDFDSDVEREFLINKDIVETKNTRIQKPKLLCELDMFVKATCDSSISGSISDSFKSESSANSRESENKNEKHEVEENINYPSKKSLKPRLCYEVEISPRRDGKGYGSFSVSLDSEKRVEKSILKCVEVENKQSQAHFNTNKELKELSFDIDFISHPQNDTSEVDFVEDETKHHQIVNTVESHNRRNLFKSNLKKKLENRGKLEPKQLNNNTKNVRASENKSYSLPHTSRSTDDDKGLSKNFLDSFAISSHSLPHPILETESINFQKNIQPCTIEKISKTKLLHNEYEPEMLSTQNFIFNPLDPLYLNLYVNYDGHRIGQLELEGNTNIKK